MKSSNLCIYIILVTNLQIINILSNKICNNTENETILQNSNLSESNFTFICENSASCNNNGECANSTHCKCKEYYTTVTDGTYGTMQCNYLQLSKASAFLLSFFLGPISVDHLFLGDFTLGVIKIILPMQMLLIGTVIFLIGKKKTQGGIMIIGKVIELMGSVVIVLWWIIDWVLILCDFYQDENGVSLHKDL